MPPKSPELSKEPKEPLGTLVYRQDDLNSLKCLVAVRMSKNFVEAVPTIDKTVRTTLTLRSGGETLTDPFAIAWFLASCDPKIKSEEDQGVKVMQWQSFSNSEIRPFLQGLVKEGHQNRRDFARTNTMRKVRLIAGLDTLNQKLMGSRFLDGNRMSLADALMAVDLTPILDPGWPIKKNPFLGDVLKKEFAFVKEWYSVVRSKTIFNNAFNQFITGNPFRSNSPKTAEPKQPGEGGDSAAEPAAVADENPKAAGKKAGRRPRKTSGSGKKSPASEKPEMPDMSGLAEKPLRVLCLHGYRQNDVSFKDKTGAFRKLVGKFCEFTFIKAPHHVLPMSNEDINQDQRGWWFSRENDYFRADDASDCDKGFDGSLDLIQKTFELHGPFDGVLGFSQGAALVALLSLIKTRNPEMLSPAVKFDFAVMVAAFKSKSTKHSHWYDVEGQPKVTIPTLHVIGYEDRVIRKPLSEDLLDLFHQPDKVFHSGGHYVPAKATQKAAYYKFLHKVGQLRDGVVQPDPKAVEASEVVVEKPKPLDKNQNQGCDAKQVINAESTTTDANVVDLPAPVSA